MLCPNCKKEIENGSKFCEHCGARVKKSKKGLWITLSVIFMAAVVTIVVTTIQELRVKIASEQYLAEQRQQELELQLQAEREARQEAERQQLQAEERKAHEEAELRKYIDLGLPSGTLWKESNEGGDYAYYTFDEAINKFGNKLPTKQQLEELISKCTWKWIGNGYKVIGPNGNSIILPAAGSRDYDSDNVTFVGTHANYWSSTLYSSYSAWDLLFDAKWGTSMGYNYRDFGFSVRLVR